MKYALIVTLALFGLLVIGSLLFIKQKVGDVRPAILPPTKDVGSVGDPLDFPLKVPEGFRIGIFAKGLGTARDLEVSSKGTLFVSIPSQGRIVALPDRDGDGRADEVKNVLTNLQRPHGIAFYNEKLFVAEETRVVRYLFEEETLTAKEEKILFPLPTGGNHVTRSLAFNKQGRLFVTIGSTCDVCFEKHEWLGAIVVSDENGNNPRLFAKGLRNSVFITIRPKTNELWGTEMGRDFLGDNLPPDEINVVKERKDYGWPVCYGNKVYDSMFAQKTAAYCESTETPVYEIAAHSAPLGLAFIDSKKFPPDWQGDLLVAYHGSWNRSTPIGYKVVRLDVEGEKILKEEDFIAGFLQGASALGRPVDLTFDNNGALYISDDKGGIIYKVSYNLAP